jgi:type I restriction enzyme S subunit
MSNKAEIRGLVPKLRFPEFLEAGEWGKKKIGKALIEQPRPIDMDDEEEYSLVTVKRRYGGVVSRGVFKGKSIKVKTQFLLQENDFLISKRQIVHCACGVVPKTLDGSIVSNEYSVLRARDGFDVLFFDYFSQQTTVSQSFLRCSIGIVIEKMLFKLKDWLKEEFLFPLLQEQQKIADCLASIDELITLEAQQLDTLKTHKKGLMQQLFPAEGETLPKLRFPEFRDAGEWEEKRLSSMVNLISGLHLSPDEYSKEGEVPYFTGPSDFTSRTQEVSKWIRESTSIANENDTLITVKGSGVGEVWYLMLPSVAMGRQLMAVRTINGSSRFIFQFLLTKRTRFEDLASGNLIPGLSRGDILDLEARFPSLPEQQKIADCLTSLDGLITAQTQKLAALKTHKKGLMQQLFPALDEVPA